MSGWFLFFVGFYYFIVVKLFKRKYFKIFLKFTLIKINSEKNRKILKKKIINSTKERKKSLKVSNEKKILKYKQNKKK